MSLVTVLFLRLLPSFFKYIVFISLGLLLIFFGIFMILAYHTMGEYNSSENLLRLNYVNFILENKIKLIIIGSLLIACGIMLFIFMFKYLEEL